MTYVPPVSSPPPTCPEFYSEAVIVCDKYSDFLGKTLPHNKYQFNKLVVVTSFEDKETQRICEHWHVECIKTDVLETRKERFCKGKGINIGLEKLTLKGWVTHMDADILLPPQTKIILENADLDKQDLYGIDRFNLRGYREYAEFIDRPVLQHECNTYIHIDKYRLGTRIMHEHAGGYVPLGFFQMWNPLGSGIDRYPEGHTDAGREDTVFSQLWPRKNRQMIPEIIGYHFESNDSRMAANWNGRVTEPFIYRREV